jgi:hypothetical protein
MNNAIRLSIFHMNAAAGTYGPSPSVSGGGYSLYQAYDFIAVGADELPPLGVHD